MSLAALRLSPPSRHPRLSQALLAAAAIAAVALVAALLVACLAPGAAAPAPRNPFGIGAREAAPAASAIGRVILSFQASFNRALETALVALKREGGSPWPLVSLGFLYGVFHAAGPGHGKGIISAYLLANERALLRGFAIGLAAACLQGAVAVAVVAVAAVLLRATAPTVTHISDGIETASFAAVALLGLALTYRKAGRLRALAAGGGEACAPGECRHATMPSPALLAARPREILTVVAAAGLRPCAGAILILVFGLSQGVFGAGVAAVAAMSLGTAATTGTIAALAVFAKRLALRFAGPGSRRGALAVGGLELLVAAFVAVLGGALVAGLSVGIAAG